MNTALCPLSVPAATLRFPFRQRNFFRGFVLPNHGNHNSSVVSRCFGFAEAWTPSPSGSPCTRKRGRREMRTEEPGLDGWLGGGDGSVNGSGHCAWTEA